MRHSRLFIAAAVLLALASTARCAEVPAIQRMLPAKDSVKGFAILSGSLQYGKGNDLTKIYNGGFELYTNNGVVDAVRQMYNRDSDYVEVTLHTMKTPRAALAFLKYWQKENKVKTLTKSGKATGFTITKPNVSSYFVVGKYFATVSAFYAEKKAKPDVKAFAAVIAKSFAK